MISLVVSNAIYMSTVVGDHFTGIRSQLNLAGMRSNSYTIGIVLADFTLYLIPVVIVTAFGCAI